MSSVSVRFNSFLFSYSIFNERKEASSFGSSLPFSPQISASRFRFASFFLGPGSAGWSVWMDSNHRPRAYQARALAT